VIGKLEQKLDIPEDKQIKSKFYYTFYRKRPSNSNDSGTNTDKQSKMSLELMNSQPLDSQEFIIHTPTDQAIDKRGTEALPNSSFELITGAFFGCSINMYRLNFNNYPQYINQ